MQNRFILFYIITTSLCIMHGAPIVQSTVNKSQIGFLVLFHNDTSSCSLIKSNNTIDALSTFKNEFLLVRDDPQQPSLILRPKYYFDTATKSKFSLLDNNNDFDTKKINRAYLVWKANGAKRNFKNSQEWFEHWVGKDIVIIPDSREVFGYLNNKSRAHISNSIKEHGQWLSYSKGIFAHLMVEIEIYQHPRKGIYPAIKVVAGEGGICTNGIIEYI